jgi:glycerate 2-kinase
MIRAGSVRDGSLYNGEMQPEARFGSRVLRPGPGQELRALACRAMAAALDAVEPAAAVERWLRRDGDILDVGGRRYRLSDFERIFVVGAGKAGAPMAAAVERVLGERLTAGLVTVKRGYAGPTRLVTLREGGHPLPDAASVAGGRAIEELLSETTERDLVVCLLSGGGSALLTLPEAPVSLEDFQRLTELLLRAGATINELNAVRKHLDAVKGGGLARMAQPAEVVTLILSDVVGNPLDVIASGPTVPDTTTFADAWEVVERFGLVERLPASVASRLRAGLVGTVPETPKPGDAALARVQNVVIASNEQAAQAALRQAESDGLHALLLTTFLEGEAREVGRVVSALARGEAANATPLARPACLILGGETTVTVRGDGRGGRNQELALAAAFPIQGLPEVLIASLATDGTDGPTDAAGAMVDGTTLARAGRAGLDARAALERNDAYPFFERLGDLLVTGPTNTNVNDLVLVLVR